MRRYPVLKNRKIIVTGAASGLEEKLLNIVYRKGLQSLRVILMNMPHMN